MSSTRPDTGPATERPVPRRAWSLAARLTLWYAGSSFLLIAGATGFLYWAFLTSLDREDDQLLAEKIHILRRVLRDRPESLTALSQEVEWQRVGRQHLTIWVRVLDRDGRLVLETPGMGQELPVEVFPEAADVTAEPGGGAEIDAPSGKPYRVTAARAAAGPSDAATHTLQLAIDRTFEEALLADYRRRLLLVLGAALAACAGTGYFIARRGLRPVGRMAATAGRISSANLHERLDLRGLPAELAQLAETFNAMLDRLEESFQRLARFSADIAHELRTPVNNLRGEAEVALGKARSPDEYRDVLGSGLEECGRLARLIDSLLFLARAESPQAEVVKEPVDLGRELETVCTFYEAAAAEAGVTLTVQAPAGLVVDVDRGLFQRALGNLVANALAHTPRGGRVTLGAARDGDAARVEVADTGSGIPAEHLPHVWDRFYRADPARPTASGRVGLGLALVKSITALHRGTAEIHSEVSRGTRVRLTLPGARDADKN
jgi:two-component system heavy metal sensor histidine kinase CusS